MRTRITRNTDTFHTVFHVKYYKYYEKIAVKTTLTRGGSRPPATSKMERFVIIVNDWKTLTIITKRSILDVATALDPLPLTTIGNFFGKKLIFVSLT